MEKKAINFQRAPLYMLSHGTNGRTNYKKIGTWKNGIFLFFYSLQSLSSIEEGTMHSYQKLLICVIKYLYNKIVVNFPSYMYLKS
jgi:hypothetical protein